MDVTVATYTSYPDLYRVASSLIDLPYKKVALTNWSPRYVDDLLQIKSDWVIHVDEDAFVTNSSRIQGLIEYMEAHNYACCGMPDGGIVPIRFHNPVACNPFFIIINRKLIAASIESDPDVHTTAWNEAYIQKTPKIAMAKGLPYAFDGFEPYYGFFFWLCKHNYDILYLDAEQWKEEPEQITTQMSDHEGIPFVLHTWYSRNYREKRRPIRSTIKTIIKGISELLPICKKGAHYARIRRAASCAITMSKNNPKI